MKKLQEFSLNDYVHIKLINDGEEILLDYFSNWGEAFNKDFIFKMYEYNDNWIRIQVWDLINIFGKYINMGNNKLPFEISNCRLEVI